jgi:hypothetical protein
MSTQGAYVQAWVPKELKVRFKQSTADVEGGMSAVLKELMQSYCDRKAFELTPRLLRSK